MTTSIVFSSLRGVFAVASTGTFWILCRLGRASPSSAMTTVAVIAATATSAVKESTLGRDLYGFEGKGHGECLNEI